MASLPIRPARGASGVSVACARGSVRAAALACILAASSAMAQVYVGQDSQGGVVLSNHPGEQARDLLIADPRAAAVLPTAATSPGLAATPALKPRQTPSPDLAIAIRRTAQRHALPETLLTALIAVESGFDQRAVSPKGARGLMQLMPATARRFGVRDPFSVEDNLEGGATYLRWLLGQFDQDVTLALAAYNAGEGAVERAGRRVPAYRETQDYVRKVLSLSSTGEPTPAQAARR